MDIGLDNFYRDLKGIPNQGILDASATQKYPLGTRYAKNDGRVFRYAKAGSVALVAGNLIQSAALGGADTTVQHDLTPAAAAAGSYTVTVTLKTTAQAKDTFKNGWLAVTDGDAANAMGDLYLIKSHPAADGGAACVITLYEPLKRAITTNSRISLLANIYSGVIQAPATTPTGLAVGVAPTAVPANNYFWLQTWGIANVLIQTATTAGVRVQRDVGAAGAVGKTANTILTEIVGMCGYVNDTTDAGFVFLTIAP